MRILLVVYDNDSFISWFPQGLAYVAAMYKKAGHEVVVYSQDVYHYPESHLTAYLARHHFDLVGVSVIAGYYQYRKLLKISEAINAAPKRPLFVIGGHGPAPEPEYFLKKTGADLAVIGEGEQTALDILDVLEGRRTLSDVQGIAFLQGGKLVKTARRPLLRDLDDLPLPAYELFAMDHYTLLRMPHISNADRCVPMLSGRGCTFRCSFCYRMDKGFRPRSAEGIIEEIRLLKTDYGVTYIAFADELLMSSEKRTVELCEAFIKAKVNIRWSCNGRLNFAKPGILRVMKRAGCVFINYGIEAVDDLVLKRMNKKLTVKQIMAGIESTLACGISPGYNIIFGNIGDTRATLQQGVEFLLKYDDHSQLRTIRPVTPYPGCDLYYEAIRRGMLRDVADFYESKHLNSDLVSVNFTDMTDEEFHEALFEANRQLLKNYYTHQMDNMIRVAEDLYLNRNTAFRGFRQ